MLEKNPEYLSKPETIYQMIPRQADQVLSVLASIDPILNYKTLYQKMIDIAELGKFQMAIVSMNASGSSYLINGDDTIKTTPSTDDEDFIGSEDNQRLIENIYVGVLNGDLDLDKIMASTAHWG